MHALADDADIVRLLIRTIRNPHTAGQIDKRNLRTGLLLKFHRQLEQKPCQCRIILVGHGIACQKRMDSEAFCSLCFQHAERLKQLLCCHTILRISRIVHDIIADGKQSARIVAAGDRLRDIADGFLQKVNVRKIIQIDNRTQLFRQLIFARRSHIGRKHDFIPRESHCAGEHQLRLRRAVAPAAIFPENFNQCRIRIRLHCKVLAESRIPGKRLLHGSGIFPDPLFVVNVERGRNLRCNFFQFLFCYKRLFQHLLLFSFFFVK